MTLLQRSSHILSDTDEEIGLDLTGFLREEEIEVVASLDLVYDGYLWQGHGNGDITQRAILDFRGIEYLVVTIRAANTEYVSDIPVQLSHSSHGGFIASHTLQTSMFGLYAAGDCVADSPQYVYTAAAEGKLAALNALASLKGQKETPMDHSVP